MGQFFRGEELLFSNVNSLGLYICLILPLLLGVAFEPGRSLIDRSGRLAIAGIALVMLLLSHTATAWVTGGLQLLLFFLLLPACRRLLAGLLAATLVVSAFFLILTADSFTGVNGKTLKGEIKQLQTLLTGRADTDSSAARLDLMKLAARLGGQRPVVGWGWGRFDRESASFGDHPDFKRSEPVVFMGDAHSMYFNLWVRGGALALAGVLLIHLLGAWRLWQISRRPGGMGLAIPALILLLSIFLYSLGGDIFQFRYKGAVLFWSVLGFAAMYRRELDDEAS